MPFVHIGMFVADRRQQAVYQAFADRGYQVKWIGSDSLCQPYDMVLLPMPAGADGVHVFEGGMLLRDAIPKLHTKRLFGGRCSEAVKTVAKEAGLVLHDYFEREEMTVLNVIPTVEGALQIAMAETEFTLHSARTLVCGFGRIGKLLSHRLRGLGAEVSVSARKRSDIAWCEALDYQSVCHSELRRAVEDKDIIFNTVPELILDKSVLTHMKPSTLILDLASAPGGLDRAEAEKLGIRVLQALGLPAKCAPKTAGEIICKTILNIYKEENTYGG